MVLVPVLVLTAACARADCEDTRWGPLSSSVDHYLASIEAAAAAGMSDEAIPEIIHDAGVLQRECAKLESEFSSSGVEMPQRVAERLAFIRFFTPIVLVRYDQEENRLTFAHLAEHGITEEGVANDYAAIPLGDLEHLESSIRSGGGGAVSLPRPPFELQSVIHGTSPGLWAQLGQQTIGELRRELESLCAREAER